MVTRDLDVGLRRLHQRLLRHPLRLELLHRQAFPLGLAFLPERPPGCPDRFHQCDAFAPAVLPCPVRRELVGEVQRESPARLGDRSLRHQILSRDLNLLQPRPLSLRAWLSPGHLRARAWGHAASAPLPAAPRIRRPRRPEPAPRPLAIAGPRRGSLSLGHRYYVGKGGGRSHRDRRDVPESQEDEDR